MTEYREPKHGSVYILVSFSYRFWGEIGGKGSITSTVWLILSVFQSVFPEICNGRMSLLMIARITQTNRCNRYNFAVHQNDKTKSMPRTTAHSLVNRKSKITNSIEQHPQNRCACSLCRLPRIDRLHRKKCGKYASRDQECSNDQ